MEKDDLKDKKILIVDDEQDVLDSLEELLTSCDLTEARTYDEAIKALNTDDFDIAILDIMGVDGYQLLDKAREKGMIAVMLTANALSLNDTVKSFKGGAASYVPKEKMIDIEEILLELLETQKKGRSFLGRWLLRFNSYYEKKFGSEWQDKDKTFWDKHGYWL